jgi:hypothetical protein
VPISYVNRVVVNCIAAFNSGSGFFLLEYADYYRTNARLYNNVSYKNGKQGFHFSRNEAQPAILGVWRNNISYQNTGIDFDNAYQVYTESNNSWDFVPDSYPGYVPSAEVTVTDADFVSLNPGTLSGPRKADGSLPDVDFFRLTEGSDLKGAGFNVGMSNPSDIGIDWAFVKNLNKVATLN